MNLALILSIDIKYYVRDLIYDDMSHVGKWCQRSP